MAEQQRFFGKYRGMVESNRDLLGLGRLQVSVPDVYPDGSKGWAMPCLPYAGPGVGWFFIPPVRAAVWVEFEQGDPDRPIWTGCFWREGESPGLKGPQQEQVKLLKTEQFQLEIDDQPGTSKLTVAMNLSFPAGEAVIEAGAAGLKVSSGKNVIELNADGVSINQGNFQVLP